MVHFAGFQSLPELLLAPLSPDEVRRRWIASPAVASFERGRLTPDEFAGRFDAEWGLRCSRPEFLSQLLSWAGDFYPGARELVAEVRQVLPAACFSNTNELHWHKNFTAYGIPQSFDQVFASFELGVVKPEREAFELVISRLGLRPEAILFLDDTEVNVEAARSVGLHSECVRGVDDSRAALTRWGVLG